MRLAISVLLAVLSVSATAEIVLPSAEGDARFIHVAGGSGLSTFQSEGLSIGLYHDGSSLTVDIFDGAVDWTFDANPPGISAQEIALYRDLDADGLADASEPIIASASIFDLTVNSWATLYDGPAVPGYYVVFASSLVGQNGANRFKLRVDSDGAHSWNVREISLIASGSSYEALYLSYPNYPDLTPALYDGVWDVSYLIDNPVSNCPLRSVKIWNADFDHEADTDDFNSPLLPSFASSQDQEQGANLGNPADNSGHPGYGVGDPVSLRLVANTGQVVIDDNPSGDEEWEKWWLHRYSAPSVDAVVPGLESEGTMLFIDGLDIGNAVTLFVLRKCL